MAVSLYMDVHIARAITEQLRQRGVDMLTAIEDGQSTATDENLLQRCHAVHQRLLFTHDIRFRVLAERWQAEGREFSGLLFGAHLGGTIGRWVGDLEFIAKNSGPEEWLNEIAHLPL
jgi:hypothetical protein